MSLQSWREIITNQRAAGTLFTNYTTAKTVINPDALVTIPTNYFYPGRSIRVCAMGGISNIVTTPGLMNFQIKLGSVAVYDTGNIQLNATAHTTLPFWFEANLTCRATGNGTSANFMGLATVTGIMFTLTAGQTDSAQGMQTIAAPTTAPAVGTGFDSTVANTLDFFVGFTIANAGNGVQIQQYEVSSDN